MTPSRRLALAVALAISALACGPALATAAAVVGAAEKAEYKWSMDLDCSLCHEKEYATLAGEAAGDGGPAPAGVAAAAGDADEGARAGGAEAPKGSTGKEGVGGEEAASESPIEAYVATHASRFGFTCATCHDDEAGLAEGHEKLNSGKVSKRLKKSSVSSEACLACHSWDDLAAATEGYDGLVDERGTVVNPHALPDVEEHATIACTDCHKAHTLGAKPVADSSIIACLTCYHAGVFECGTCH